MRAGAMDPCGEVGGARVARMTNVVKPGEGSSEPPPTVVHIGRRALRVPTGYEAIFQSDPERGSEVNRFIEQSPDRCVYHLPRYLEFTRRENGAAELVLLKQSGRALVALPMHPSGRSWYRTGYSGVLFPGADSEVGLKKAAAAVVALFNANPSDGFDVLQAAQAPAYDDLFRCAMIDSLLTGSHLVKSECYSRLIRLTPTAGAAPAAHGTVAFAALDNDLLRSYESDVRNQIRQASRHGIELTYNLLFAETNADTRRAAYEPYLSIHRASWTRTGLQAHRDAYWLSLSEAISQAGGRDLVVVARTGEGTPVAGVTCHLFHDRAIYWSSGSLEDGLRLRSNPLCLHGAITLCRDAGIATFEIGRFEGTEPNRKERAITAYKTQFRGSVVRLVNFSRPPTNLTARLRRAGARVVRSITQKVRR